MVHRLDEPTALPRRTKNRRKLVARRGFEPQSLGYEPNILPLEERAINWRVILRILSKGSHPALPCHN
jgi:hypothetical protein